MIKRALFLILTATALGMISCGGKTVSRVETDMVTDLSGRWNDTDSRLVAEEMVKDSLNRPWVDNFMKKRGTEPTVIVGTVVNRSHEHINVQTFVKDLQRELTNSGRVSFVAGKGEREEIREERLEQAQNSSDETAKGPGQEIGADYMMIGTINTILDEADGTKAVFYQVDLEMVDMANNKKVWLGQKKIKKLIEKSRIKF
ncbi:MAG: penicillin-binding protein activator LpoB [Candidatus Manganitrophus sp.]|nr:penicillin-binding protein activator LpoB [Candidatus Manganitrophus sp.]MDC4223670.1 penicillin-binding protein activator LpoB [Candidatus Manganitrophus sp.]WDT70066.1 MAG: penicillin-binding protein activator LpoB [Candidatus Manganitrophus sp.]WDT78280.1 MAG: penicillin-binding protein activator LpoB [Candidatus Manganitrophus sp.]